MLPGEFMAVRDLKRAIKLVNNALDRVRTFNSQLSNPTLNEKEIEKISHKLRSAQSEFGFQWKNVELIFKIYNITNKREKGIADILVINKEENKDACNQ